MILPKLTSSSLISLGQLCDDNCAILLNKTKLLAIKKNKIILRGTRNPNDKLWDIPIQKQGLTQNNYKMPPIHPAMYQTRNACEETSGSQHLKYQSDHQAKEPESLLFELKQFDAIIDHNILDTFLCKNAPTEQTINTTYDSIAFNPQPIQGVAPHPNDKPRQPSSRLTNITYLNKGYNATTPARTKTTK